jgi:hypothetical protein
MMKTAEPSPDQIRESQVTPLRLLVCALCSLALVVFTGCESTRQPSLYLSHFDLKPPAVNDFEVCASAGCRKKSSIGYTPNEWQSIRSVFEPAPASAAEERERIQTAIAAIEQIIGVKNGTSGDAPRNDRELGTGAQLDCIAEAANTTVALLLFDQEGLLKFHRVGYPQHRGFFQLRLPHNAASIYENETNAHYVVDSWFYRNGEPPVCVPVNEWRAGYDPED